MIAAAAALWFVAPVIAPFDPSFYTPPSPLPAGLQPARFEDYRGKRVMCMSGPECSPATETFAGWYGKIGPSQRRVRVELSALAPATAISDGAWARKVRLMTYDLLRRPHRWFQHRGGTLRVWRSARGRIAQSEVQYGGRETDPAWKLARHEERDGWTLYIAIRYDGVPDEATRALLRAAFVDGPLGAPPATAKAGPVQ